jgi:hypothetical protein
MTLLHFVHRTNVFFDSSLRLEIFHDFSTWKKECKTLYECDNTNWEFKDTEGSMGSDARHMEVLLRGLQAMAMEESMLKHTDNWNIVAHVFKWSKDDANLDGETNEEDAAKSRLAVLTKDRIAGMGTKGYCDRAERGSFAVVVLD